MRWEDICANLHVEETQTFATFVNLRAPTMNENVRRKLWLFFLYRKYQVTSQIFQVTGYRK